MKVKRCVLLCALIAVVLVPADTTAADTTGHDTYYMKGRAALEAGTLDEAIENFKKVLYVNRCHARAVRGLVDAYEQRGDIRHARKELRYFLNIVDADPLLSEASRDELVVWGYEKEKEFALLVRTQKALYTGKLNTIELNIVLLALMVNVFLLIKGMRAAGAFVRTAISARKEKKIWLDRYWERRAGKPVRTASSYFITSALVMIYCVVSFYAARIILIYGVLECAHSFSGMVKSFF